MTGFMQAALSLGIAANTVSIWFCIKTYWNQQKRIMHLEVRFGALEHMIVFNQGRYYGTGIQSMAKDTEVAE